METKFLVSTNREGKLPCKRFEKPSSRGFSQNNCLRIQSSVFSSIVSYTRRPSVRKENTICFKPPFSFLRPPTFYITGSWRAQTRKPAARSSLGFCACIMSLHLSISTRKDNSTKGSWETVRASVCVPEILGTRMKSPSSPSCLVE